MYSQKVLQRCWTIGYSVLSQLFEALPLEEAVKCRLVRVDSQTRAASVIEEL